MGDRICVMKLGHIMQVDTPDNLYHKPKNMFVAGFIGAPEMNIRPSQLVEPSGSPASDRWRRAAAAK
ncbi:ABC sugar transporter [Klebsiella oxytoca]|nr:ABC sugar transporter [Klebsiella oxytoca]